MNVLFVCTENVARSRVAERLFRELQGGAARHAVRSVGTAPHAARRLTTRDLAWADVVGVMEASHLEFIRTYWPHHAGKVVVLGVADFFLPEELELRAALESKLRVLLERCRTPAPPPPAPSAEPLQRVFRLGTGATPDLGAPAPRPRPGAAQ